jgi:hypothetical protein
MQVPGDGMSSGMTFKDDWIITEETDCEEKKAKAQGLAIQNTTKQEWHCPRQVLRSGQPRVKSEHISRRGSRKRAQL